MISVDDPVVVGSGDGGLSLRLDPESGQPIALVVGAGPARVALPLTVSATLVTEGSEVFEPPHGLGYADTVDLARFARVEGSLRHRVDGRADVYRLQATSAGWTATWEYTFRQRHPRVGLAVELTPSDGEGKATLRDLRLEIAAGLPDIASWLVEMPGNDLRPGVPVSALIGDVDVSTAGGVRGSTGLVAAHSPQQRRTVVVWPLCHTEIGHCRVRGGEEALRVTLDTGLAGRLEPQESLRYEALHLDLLDATWEETRADLPSWYPRLGIATPTDRPDWVSAASIFEVQVGYSVFWGGYRYEPYPDVRALIADLDRIAELGYDVLQIMPRQPYPSYNVHDYADVSTTYGDEDDLRTLADTCHAMGMRVILDILLHGVIDQEVMAATAGRVRSGPFFDRLAENTTLVWGGGQDSLDARVIAWSRHILDFEPHWSGGSPRRHPLADEHPDWFMRDSAQEIIGVYTKAFDVANPWWQDYFCAVAEELVRRLDVDGFRFDAPTYNALPNWSEATQRRASYSPLGCLELFDQLRRRLKCVKESVMLYTEPSGVLFHQNMDVTYNYDEQRLIPAVLRQRAGHAADTGVRNGRELAAWLRDRDAVLPPGFVIAHHVDSHDTFWWPLPGEKWRREQYGAEAIRALLAVFALSGGAYMTFVGGERGIEPEVRRAHRLRAALPEIRTGSADYDAVSVDAAAVFAVARRKDDRCSLVLVNLSDADVTAACAVDAARLGVPGRAVVMLDVWDDAAAEDVRPAAQRDGTCTLPLSFGPYQVRVLSLRHAEG